MRSRPGIGTWVVLLICVLVLKQTTAEEDGDDIMNAMEILLYKQDKLHKWVDTMTATVDSISLQTKNTSQKEKPKIDTALVDGLKSLQVTIQQLTSEVHSSVQKLANAQTSMVKKINSLKVVVKSAEQAFQNAKTVNRKQREEQIRKQKELDEQIRKQKAREEEIRKQRERDEQVRKQREREEQIRKQKERDEQIRKQKERDEQIRKQKERDEQIRKQKKRDKRIKKQKEKEERLRKQKAREEEMRKQKAREEETRKRKAREDEIRKQRDKQSIRRKYDRERKGTKMTRLGRDEDHDWEEFVKKHQDILDRWKKRSDTQHTYHRTEHKHSSTRTALANHHSSSSRASQGPIKPRPMSPGSSHRSQGFPSSSHRSQGFPSSSHMSPGSSALRHSSLISAGIRNTVGSPHIPPKHGSSATYRPPYRSSNYRRG